MVQERANLLYLRLVLDQCHRRTFALQWAILGMLVHIRSIHGFRFNLRSGCASEEGGEEGFPQQHIAASGNCFFY